jgi:hypothetical protein
VEEPVVSKRAVVREEVVVGKETSERTETIRDKVRHSEVRVDPIAGSARGAETETPRQPAAEAAVEPGAGPAYAYGSRIAGEPRFSGRAWKEAENDIRVDYMRNNPMSRWDEAKADIRRGWDKVKGQR